MKKKNYYVAALVIAGLGAGGYLVVNNTPKKGFNQNDVEVKKNVDFQGEPIEVSGEVKSATSEWGAGEIILSGWFNP